VAGGPDPLGDVDGISRPQDAGVDPAADGDDEHPERPRAGPARDRPQAEEGHRYDELDAAHVVDELDEVVGLRS
jgi:hypothetical protein